MREEESMQRCISCCMLGSVGSRAPCVCVVCAALLAMHAVGSVYTAVESRECCARCARLLVLATMWCVNETEFLASFMFPNSFRSAPISHPAELRERRPTKHRDAALFGSSPQLVGFGFSSQLVWTLHHLFAARAIRVHVRSPSCSALVAGAADGALVVSLLVVALNADSERLPAVAHRAASHRPADAPREHGTG